MAEDTNVRRRRAGYRANHRGTKEMDWLLGRYADATVADMDDPELAEFERFIAIADPELHNWIVNPAQCEHSEFAGLLEKIRAFHKFDN